MAAFTFPRISCGEVGHPQPQFSHILANVDSLNCLANGLGIPVDYVVKTLSWKRSPLSALSCRSASPFALLRVKDYCRSLSALLYYEYVGNIWCNSIVDTDSAMDATSTLYDFNMFRYSSTGCQKENRWWYDERTGVAAAKKDEKNLMATSKSTILTVCVLFITINSTSHRTVRIVFYKNRICGC